MRILYIASGIPVPGTLGGSTHAYEVARGLAARGHELHLVAAGYEGWGGLAPFTRPVTQCMAGFYLHQQNVPKVLALPGGWPIWRLARMLRPDIIMERYYNFAGAGLLAARRLKVPSILEVNALIVDPPAVRKRRLDDALGGPMRRWATLQCHWASRIITPLHTTVPPGISRTKIIELPWGAAVERFGGQGSGVRDRGSRIGSAPDPRSPISDPRSPNVVFLGSFRAWHGVTDFVRAALLLIEHGHNLSFTLVGDGPERAVAERLAAPYSQHFRFTGSIPYEAVPGELARAAVGVAPFNTAPHPALRAAGFFWSPLKIYEYMAAGLPVVTADIAPLNTIIREGCEGALFQEGNPTSLAEAIARVLHDPAGARAMGARARERVVEHYSWQRHCTELERIMQELLQSAD